VSERKATGLKPKAGYFWRLNRLCIPLNSELRLRLSYELHVSSPTGHIGVASTLAKTLDMFYRKRVRQGVQDFCERWVMCRRGKIQIHMAATLNPLRVPPIPWHTAGLIYLTHLHVSNGFDIVLIVIHVVIRMAKFMPCKESVATSENVNSFLHGVYR
jgi:hypothetical protein